jgi:hypothetical protein
VDKVADRIEPGLIESFGLAAGSLEKIQANALDSIHMVGKLTDAGDVGGFG